jgi:hypothetical protein
MSERDGFTGGFFIGAVVGGIVGGVLGTIFTARNLNRLEGEADKSLLKPGKNEKFSSEESIEIARRSLEDKIAQLNSAIDDVREQLGSVNGNASEQE